MAKYVLNSGGIRNAPELKKQFHREIIKDLGSSPKFLLCNFAQAREYWEVKFQGYSNTISEDMPEGAVPTFELAIPDKFANQCKQADVIYFHGGDEHLLHPFKDANGRTARVMGFAFSEYYSESSPDYDEDFNYLAQSRDELREAGTTTLPVSYVPSMSQQLDYNDPQSVIRYFDKLLDPSYDNESLYQGIMNQSPAFMSK